MWWPSNTDPFWLANQTDNTARKEYYGVTGTPTMKCDGATSGTTQSAITSAINSRLAIPSHIWLDLSATLNGSNLEVTCTAVADQNITGNFVLQMALLDRYSYLPNSPNGQPNHYHAMLDMAPSASGQAFSVTANDTAYFYATFALSPSWSIDNLDMACFVQNNTNRDVLQARCEQVPVDFPGLYYMDYVLDDNGNHDGRAEPGETAYMYVTLGNQEPYQTAVNVVGTLSSDDTDLTFTTPTVSFPDIPNGGTGANTDPFVFDVSPSAEPHATTLHLEVVADPQQTVMTADIDIFIGWPEILLVDDDAGGVFEQYYTSTLDNMGKSYEYWDVNVQGTPSQEVAAGYPIMIWLTGWASLNVLGLEEQTLIEDYITNGGYFFISGQNIAQGMNSSGPDFLHDILHANYEVANTGNKILNGIPGDPNWGDLSVDCNTGGQGSGSCTSPDGISVIAPAVEAFIYSTGTYYGGLTWEPTEQGKLVYFSFPFEAISAQNGTNTREEVMQAILDFFGPIVSVQPREAVPIPQSTVCAYPNPFNPQTTINYALPASGRIRLSVWDVTGSRVATLVDGWQLAGNHRIPFDGSQLTSGLYIYRLQADSYTSCGKIVLMK